MDSVDRVLAELKRRGTEQTRKTLIRHGAPPDTLGVSVADLKAIAKSLKGDQALACALYDTGIYDAMYLGGIVADGRRMSKAQLEAWAKKANCAMVFEYVVAPVAAESPHARELAMKWIGAKSESLATTGWNTYAGVVATLPDDQLNLDEVKSLLNLIVQRIGTAPNLVRYTMNAFVIAVGTCVRPLLNDAKRAAKAIGAVSVDMGDTACKVPLASAQIAKTEATGRVGKKRKTIRC